MNRPSHVCMHGCVISVNFSGTGTDGNWYQYSDFGSQLQWLWPPASILLGEILWEHLWQHKISLRCPDQVFPKLQREGDFLSWNDLSSWAAYLMMMRFVSTIVILHIEPWPLQTLSQGMAPKWQNMLWTYLANLAPWANGSGWMNAPGCNKDILRWRTRLKHLTSENLSFPFSSDLHIGYSHHILTGNGSTNDMITSSTAQQITHVMFFAPFPRGLWWPSNVLRSFLHYQCHIMSWSELRLNVNAAIYSLMGLQLMPIQRSSLRLNLCFYPAMGG
jgi:hypothetical protein